MQDFTPQPTVIHMSLGDSPSSSWQSSEQEGQLAIDVVEEETELIIITPMAGVNSETLDVQVHNNDLLTIRGERQLPIKRKAESVPVHQECFWGKFSRTLVLSAHVKGDMARAEYKNGVLVVRIPKYRPHASIPIEIVEE